MEYQKFIVSSSPHIHKDDSISSIMLDVIIALCPAVIAGVLFWGLTALSVMFTAVASCILSEYLYNKIVGKPSTIRDFSAVVTGILLGLNLPATIPLWMVVVGSVFAIIIVKQLFGGIGKNFMNPALAARCFMLVAWAGAMTTFVPPFTQITADAVSTATPLAILKGTTEGTLPSLLKCFLGLKGGCIGETSAIAILIGFIYLLIRRVVNIKIPLTYILVFAVLTFFFGRESYNFEYTLYSLLTGGLLLGACFMATDYTTTPTSGTGHIIFGAGCGILTFLIRRFGGYPEGVSFAIILMNVVSPLIDRYVIPSSLGEVAKSGK